MQIVYLWMSLRSSNFKRQGALYLFSEKKSIRFNPEPVTRKQISEDGKPFSEDKHGGFKLPCSMHHALRILLIPRTSQHTLRIAQPVTRISHHATRIIDHQAVSIHKHQGRNNPQCNPIQADKASVWQQPPQIVLR